MRTGRFDDSPPLPAGSNGPGAGVVEVGLLLPAGQALALEAAARARGVTVGQMLRSLLREFLAGHAPPPAGRRA